VIRVQQAWSWCQRAAVYQDLSTGPVSAPWMLVGVVLDLPHAQDVCRAPQEPCRLLTAMHSEN